MLAALAVAARILGRASKLAHKRELIPDTKSLTPVPTSQTYRDQIEDLCGPDKASAAARSRPSQGAYSDGKRSQDLRVATIRESV